MMRHTAPADAAASQPTAEDLPAWDLSDLYPAPDSPAVEADFAKAETGGAGVRRGASGQAGRHVRRRAGRGDRASTSGSRKCWAG